MRCRKKYMDHEKDIIETTEKEFVPFHKTFKIVTMTMVIGVMYPNPETEKFRLTMLLAVYASVVPVSFMVFYDIYLSWLRRDIVNVIRHCTVIIPFLLGLTKMYLMHRKRVEAKAIIDEINRDHELYNHLPQDYKVLIRREIKSHKQSEIIWTIIVIHVILGFAFLASVSNVYSHIFKSIPTRYMIHDLNIPFKDPEERFKTPYFEYVYIYMLYCCLILFLNFAGYDGFFGVAINHACLKMKLYCKALEDGLKLKNSDDILEAMVRVITDQCHVYRLVDTIQETFNVWLGMIFIGTVVHICNCMYQITEGFGMDLTYTIFIVGSVLHIYLPCRFASKLQSTSSETATLIYCSGWESVDDQRIRKMILFMIARAQIPSSITAFYMLTFDMELFVSILHTSYSMFTLLRS